MSKAVLGFFYYFLLVIESKHIYTHTHNFIASQRPSWPLVHAQLYNVISS